MTVSTHNDANVIALPEPVASVRHISTAPSFEGTLHDPDWCTFAIDCFGPEDAAFLVDYLRERGLFPVRENAAVTMRLDRTQPDTARVPQEVAFIAISHGWADADAALEAVLASGPA